MKTVHLVKKLEKLQNLTLSEMRSTAAAFNNSKTVLACIADYLNDEIYQIDKELTNLTTLYEHGSAHLYVACKLAERARNLKLLHLLTEETEVLDADPAGE